MNTVIDPQSVDLLSTDPDAIESETFALGTIVDLVIAFHRSFGDAKALALLHAIDNLITKRVARNEEKKESENE